jgi:hypothetical protein
VAVPAILPGAALPARRRLLLVAAFVGLNATWWLPGLLNPAVAVSDPAGASGFALRPESWGGPLLTALGLGGVWNSDVQLATRALPWIPVVALVIAGLAAIGIPRFFDVLAPHLPKDVADVRTQPQPQPQLDREIAQPKTGRWVGGWLLGLATVSLIVVVLGSWGLTSGAMRWIVSEVPGGGLLRDSQKLLVFLTLVLALAAPLGAATLARRISAPAALGLSLGTLAMLPLVTMPDLAWGAFGRLGPVDYPDGWNQLRTTIAAGEPGDVTSLPWATFRRYSWNSGRTVLDPMPRYLTRTVVVDDRLPVARGDSIEFVSGDNPRSAALAAELATDRRLADVLPEQGIRWAVVQTDQPGQIPAGRFAGMALVGAWPGLELWQVRRPPLVTSQPNYAWLVYTVDGLVALMLIELAGARLQRLRLRKRIADVSNFRRV